MKVSDALCTEFLQESKGTRTMLERLPDDRLGWKPHEKSMSMGGLATHLANIPTWAAGIVGARELDLGTVSFRIEERTSRAAVLDFFEQNVRGFQEALAERSDEHMFESWTLKNGGNAVLTLPRVACIRSFILSHIIHHRGQLTVYFRQNEVPLPALYGPTADEAM